MDKLTNNQMMKRKHHRVRRVPLSVQSVRLSPTEERNPRSMRLDKMPLRSAIKLMLSEEVQVPAKLFQKLRPIEQAINAIVGAFLRGGRLFYVGAGTSGRLGVLDASECPPTFRTAPELVQGIIAGGKRALWESTEGGEDDSDQGAREIGSRKVKPRMSWSELQPAAQRRLSGAPWWKPKNAAPRQF